tara:strand:+ start:665 stop:943 length:279 start_codon:yes stop_codon:yes gene_type:complete
MMIVSGILSIVALIAAIAVIRYKPIGRKLLIIVATISILLTVINMSYSLIISGMAIWYSYVISFFSIIYYGAIIGYFMTSEVKNAFVQTVPS